MKQGSGVESSLAAGGPARHIPVLLEEVLEALNIRCLQPALRPLFWHRAYGRLLPFRHCSAR